MWEKSNASMCYKSLFQNIFHGDAVTNETLTIYVHYRIYHQELNTPNDKNNGRDVLAASYLRNPPERQPWSCRVS